MFSLKGPEVILFVFQYGNRMSSIYCILSIRGPELTLRVLSIQGLDVIFIYLILSMRGPEFTLRFRMSPNMYMYIHYMYILTGTRDHLYMSFYVHQYRIRGQLHVISIREPEVTLWVFCVIWGPEGTLGVLFYQHQ